MVDQWKVFIGYSNQDENYAEFLRRCLERIVEIIPYKAEFYKEFGGDFKQRIQRELYQSHFMVVLLTENGKNSQWVNQEIGFAHGLKVLEKNRVQPYIIPISNKTVELKGFITKDSCDFIVIEDVGSFELVVANVIATIRQHLKNGWKENALTMRVTCPNCLDDKGLPLIFFAKVPSSETITNGVRYDKCFMPITCPSCKKANLIDIRTFLPATQTNQNPLTSPNSNQESTKII